MKNTILLFMIIASLFGCKKEEITNITNVTQVVDTDTTCCCPVGVKTIFHELTTPQWTIVGTPGVNAFYTASFTVQENLQDSGTVNLFWSIDFFKWSALPYIDNNFKINYSFNGNVIQINLINATDPTIVAYPIFQHQPFWIKIDYIN